MIVRLKRFSLRINWLKDSDIDPYIGSLKLQKHFCKRYVKKHMFSPKLYWSESFKIKYIKQLREAHRARFGEPSGLRETKEFLDRILDAI
jgi:hypothetical protein